MAAMMGGQATTAVPPLRVAVVGAGFGGLALARALQQQPPLPSPPSSQRQRQDQQQTTARQARAVAAGCPPVRVTVLDAFESDSGLISGRLRLPSAQRVLQSLGLAEAWQQWLATAGQQRQQRQQTLPQQHLVSIEGLRTVLLGSLRPSTVRWGTSVTDVRIELDGGVSLCCSHAAQRRWETYDYVVAADGLGSTTRQAVERQWRSAAVRHGGQIAVGAIGDARWVWGRWWDLGLGRIRCGGDTALTDAIGLAAQLLRPDSDVDVRGRSPSPSRLPPRLSSRLPSRLLSMAAASILWPVDDDGGGDSGDDDIVYAVHPLDWVWRCARNLAAVSIVGTAARTLSLFTAAGEAY